MRLSLLDRSRTRHGQSESAALGHTVERAIEVEQLGYERLWVAEHHAVPGIASGSPAVLLAAIGARTTRLRLGSGGVLLPNHRQIGLSVLARSRTRHGQSESAALGHTVERAIEVEQLGYERLWVAEHHAVPGIASGSPAVLLAAIGARTTRIRLGSGGVMLPNHRPLAVAEQFRMLAALHPGRIDLGVGRSLGFTEPVRRALGRLEADPESFAREVEELRGHLEGSAP